MASDGRDASGSPSVRNTYSDRPSCVRQLENLRRIGGTFDFAVIDGNHDGACLKRELVDVSDSWFEVEEVFRSLDAKRFRKIGTDGRIGLAEKRA